MTNYEMKRRVRLATDQALGLLFDPALDGLTLQERFDIALAARDESLADKGPDPAVDLSLKPEISESKKARVEKLKAVVAERAKSNNGAANKTA